MKIVVSINHPAHVHYFKHFIREMEKRGHKILIVATHKEISFQLLDSYGFDYIKLKAPGKSVLSKLIHVPILDYYMYMAVKNFEPDVFLGFGSTRAAHASRLLKKTCINLDDTEHSKWEHLLFVPFTDVILTPKSFGKDFGEKQIRYDGYSELLYLHPNRFTPDPAVLDELGLTPDDNIFVIRFAAFDATHDAKTKHFDKRYVSDLIKKLEDKGTIVVSSEVKLDSNLQKYQHKFSPERYHDLLYFSKMYIGEGSTSAMEAAILGVPSLHFERLNIGGQKSTILPYIGVLNELQTKYQLLYSFCDEDDLLSKVDEILTDLDGAKMIWGHRRDALLNDKIDVTTFLIRAIEHYSGYFNQFKNDLVIEDKY